MCSPEISRTSHLHIANKNHQLDILFFFINSNGDTVPASRDHFIEARHEIKANQDPALAQELQGLGRILISASG